jgi:hypothetical protein
MIIFDLDGTLADCEHRRHLISPGQYKNICECSNHYTDKITGDLIIEDRASWRYIDSGQAFKHGWQAFYEVCDKDHPIMPVIKIFHEFNDYEYNDDEIQIWSGRCESVREKTETWLRKNTSFGHMNCKVLKMRPYDDHTPDDVLKEMWFLDQAILGGNKIDFVFESDLKSIDMWRRLGVFVFNCSQHD